mmetsp:Transcript_34806/g.81981  ORF Transcript_34806/g.81981 Transcript_34806/m.81981 type:complete len:276 (-) Transcript_34806:1719-2546(-)
MAAFFGFADPGRLFGFPGFADAGRLAPPAPLEEGPRPSFSAEDTRAMFPPCRGDAGLAAAGLGAGWLSGLRMPLSSRPPASRTAFSSSKTCRCSLSSASALCVRSRSALLSSSSCSSSSTCSTSSSCSHSILLSTASSSDRARRSPSAIESRRACWAAISAAVLISSSSNFSFCALMSACRSASSCEASASCACSSSSLATVYCNVSSCSRLSVWDSRLHFSRSSFSSTSSASRIASFGSSFFRRAISFFNRGTAPSRYLAACSAISFSIEWWLA